METDYKSFENAVINTFFMITYSNYPTTAIPYYKEQNINALMYFIPLILFIITIIEPIPVAVLFDWFRVNQTKVLFKDRIIERDGLMIAFLILDYKRLGYINKNQWSELIKSVFSGINDEAKTIKVFESIDI